MSSSGSEPARSRAQRNVAQTGRKLGPRAMRTREKLLEATASLLDRSSVLDLSVVEIARVAQTSPATFYHYFKDVEEAVLLLAEEAAEELPTAMASLESQWKGKEGLERARALVTTFIDHWDAHHAVLLVRNLAADNGDARFQRVRRAALTPIIDQLSAMIRGSQEEGRVAPEMNPGVAAAAIISILEKLSAHYREFSTIDASREELVETCSRIVFQTITGRPPR